MTLSTLPTGQTPALAERSMAIAGVRARAAAAGGHHHRAAHAIGLDEFQETGSESGSTLASPWAFAAIAGAYSPLGLRP